MRLYTFALFAPLRDLPTVLHMQIRSTILILTALGLASCATPKEAARPAPAPTNQMPTPVAMMLPGPTDLVARRLDSISQVSEGDYIHMQVSQCFGRCEGYVSIFRESPAKFYVYEGEAWGYNEFDRADVLFRLRRPIANDLAEGIFEKAHKAGIMKLITDTTYQVTDQPYIWVRARIGGERVVVNHAYLGGKLYMELGLNDTYAQLRKLLFSLVYGVTPQVNDGK
jgi:hypothetical protein